MTENSTSPAPVAVYRPVRTTSLTDRQAAHAGQPVVEVIVQKGDWISDPPLGFARFADGDTVLCGPDDLADWDRTFTLVGPVKQVKR